MGITLDVINVVIAGLTLVGGTSVTWFKARQESRAQASRSARAGVREVYDTLRRLPNWEDYQADGRFESRDVQVHAYVVALRAVAREIDHLWTDRRLAVSLDKHCPPDLAECVHALHRLLGMIRMTLMNTVTDPPFEGVPVERRDTFIQRLECHLQCVRGLISGVLAEDTEPPSPSSISGWERCFDDYGRRALDARR